MKQNGVDPSGTLGVNHLEQLESLDPGDIVDLWMDGTHLVKTVLLCEEDVGGRAYHWRWMFLDDGSLIEVSPDGYFRYREHRVLNQGTPQYEELVAQDGALVRFEERVRSGTSGRRPVHVTIDDKKYRLVSTGTVQVQRRGDEPDVIPWQSFSRDPEENVYFGMVDVEDDANVVLGLWTAHVCLSFGKELQMSDVSGVYRKKGR